MATADKTQSYFEVFKNVGYQLYLEYLERSVTHGMRMIRRTQGDSYGRYIWLVFMAWILTITHMDVYRLLMQFMQAPTETRLSSKVVHIKHIPFPSIAICSTNQISKKALNSFSEQLFDFQQRHHPNLAGTSWEEVADKLLSFNDYYMQPLEIRKNDDKTVLNLHALLALNGNGTYSSRSILRILAPKCEDMVLRCYHGDYNPINCSEVFLLRMTGVGPCCVMNYRRGIDVLDLSISEGNRTFANRTIQVTTSGIRSAVQIVLQDNTTDFEWNTLGYDGYRVMLFNPENYPDPASGGISISIANHDEEHEISIVPDVLEGSSRMKQFSPAKRHCYFLEEGKQLIQQPYYSFGECMVDCQIRSTINHCGCVIPILSAENYNATYCSLLDLQCVSLWKPVWLRHNPFNYVSMEEGFNNCNHCMPSCSVLTYNKYVNSKPLNLPVDGGNYTVGVLAGLSSTIPTTVIKFFYKSSFSQIKTHDISGDWVALLGRYGGICGIMYGFSIIAIIELIYFITGKWWTLWWNSMAECFKNRQRSKVENEIHQELYWQELQPQVAFPLRKVGKKILN